MYGRGLVDAKHSTVTAKWCQSVIERNFRSWVWQHLTSIVANPAIQRMLRGMDYEIDNLDHGILRILQEDARTPYVEIARELDVSGGTIHVRVGKMKEAGVLLGTKQIVNHRALGYEVTALVGLRVTGESGIKDVCEKLKTIPEIVEVLYTTGTFSLVAKVMARSMGDLYELLAGKLREHSSIASTETFLVLNTELQRDPQL